MNHFKRFTISYVTCLTLLVLSIILLNWIVNPYNIYRPPLLKQVQKKPLVSTHLRLAKARAVEWKKPQFLILGSSTAETGLNPEFSAWTDANAYNLGLSGANIYEVMRYLQHAQSVTPLKKVVLAVNFFMFNAYVNNRDDFDESLLNVDADGNKNPVSINNIFITLLSYDAIKASIETLKNQDKNNAFKTNGQLHLKYREEQVNQLKGYKNNFLYTERFNSLSLLPPPLKIFSFKNPEKNIDTLHYMQKIISICEKNNTELILIIAPEHVRLTETYQLLGLWKLYEQWQQSLVQMISIHNRKYPDFQYNVWGFNKLNEMTTEQLPEKNDTQTNMQWFWDPYHFKSQLGDLILASLFEKQNQPDSAHFSSILSLETIENELKTNRYELSLWEKVHPDEVQELREQLHINS